MVETGECMRPNIGGAVTTVTPPRETIFMSKNCPETLWLQSRQYCFVRLKTPERTVNKILACIVWKGLGPAQALRLHI